MDKAQALVLDYDDEEDILYVSFKMGQEAVCIEQENGVLTVSSLKQGKLWVTPLLIFWGNSRPLLVSQFGLNFLNR